MDSFTTFMGEQVKDMEHATEFMEMLNNIDLTSFFKISKKKQPNAQCSPTSSYLRPTPPT